MKRLTTIIAFLFLSSLVFTSGFFLIRAQAQLSTGGNLFTQQNPPQVMAGDDRQAVVGQTLTLEGTATDEGVVNGIGWTTSGTGCSLSATTPHDTGTASARAVASIVCTQIGDYTVTLTAIDNTQAYASDSLVLHVSATSSGTSNESAFCGNGKIENNEECDGADLRGNTCSTLSFASGTLTCRTNCTLNISGCSNPPATPPTDTSGTGSTDTTNTNTTPPPTTQPGTTNTTSETDTTAPTSTAAGIAPVVRTEVSYSGEEGTALTIVGEARDDRLLTYITWSLTSTNCSTGPTHVTNTSEHEARAEMEVRCLPGTYTATILAADDEGLRTLQRTTLMIRKHTATSSGTSVNTGIPPTGVSAGPLTSGSKAQPLPATVSSPSMITKLTPPPPTLEVKNEPLPGANTGSTGSATDQQANTDYRTYCLQRQITDDSRCQALLSENIPPLCKAAGKTSPADCEAYIKETSLTKRCAGATNTDGSTCEEIVFKQYAPELYCGILSPDECKKIVTERLIGRVATAADQRNTFVQSLNAAVGPHATLGEITKVIEQSNSNRDILPLIAGSNQTVLLRAAEHSIDVSNKVTVETTAPYLMLTDDDGDGLPNDMEAFHGSDSKNSDTDNDGFSDLDEIRNGYDPIRGVGIRLEHPLSAVELSLIGSDRMEQPVTSGTTDAAFSVDDISTISENGTTAYRISGTAEPDSIVLVYIYSSMPLVLTVKTDSSGNWIYTLTDGIVEGKHNIYVAVTDQTGKIVKKSSPGNFFIRGAKAVSAEDFFATQAQVAAATPTAERNSPIRSYLIGGISIVVLGLAFVWFLIVRKRANA